MRTHEPRQGKIDRSYDRQDETRTRRRRAVGGVAAAVVFAGGLGLMYGHARGIDQTMNATSQARIDTDALRDGHAELSRVASELAEQSVEVDDPSIVATFELGDGQSIISAVEGTGYSAPKEMFPYLLQSARGQGIVQPGDRFAVTEHLVTEHLATKYSFPELIEGKDFEATTGSFAVIQPLKKQEEAS